MANSNPQGITPLSFKAGAAIAVGETLMMDSTNSKQVVKTTAITDLVIGIALNSAASGEQVNVQTQGIAKVLAGGACTINAEVMSGGTVDGRAETASGATARSFGVALEAATTSGEMIEVLLFPCPKGPANS